MKNKILDISKRIGKLESVEFIYLFGSKVNNPTKANSDIDFCIVIDDYSNKESVFEKIVDLIEKEKTLIHPVIYDKKDFDNKIKIKTYRESIIENGKLMYKK